MLVFEVSDVSGVILLMSILHIFSRGLQSGKMSVRVGMEKNARSKTVTLVPLKACCRSSYLKLVSLDGSSHEKTYLEIPMH